MPKARINTPDAMFQVDKKRAADHAQLEALVDEHRGYRRNAETSDRGVAGVGGGRAETGHETDGKATGERAPHTQQADRPEDGSNGEPEDDASDE
jgi:hypothetical protein